VNPIASARIAFAGTPDFAVPILAALIEAGSRIQCVLTQPDRPAGRGRELRQPPVKRLAVEREIAVLQPGALDEQLRGELAGQRPDLLVVAAYGKILPQWMLEWPKIAPVNVHASLLPRWRGAAPIQRAILAGDETTGVSIMHVAPSLDSGPVYARAATVIGPAETAGELHDRLALLGAELLVRVLPGILSGDVEPEPQNDEEASYAPKIRKSEAVIDWTKPAAELARLVRAYNPWPVAETRMPDGGRLRIWEAEAMPDESAGPPGTVVDTAHGAIGVAAGGGLLRLKQVQPPGGRVMDAGAYLAAHDLRRVRFVGSG
jgi:methionyl-tRNA formyltransferase